MLDVLIMTPKETLFEGSVSRVIFPGEMGVFEVLPFHKPLLSRLIGGIIFVGKDRFEITRGVAQVKSNKVIAIVEQ